MEAHRVERLGAIWVHIVHCVLHYTPRRVCDTSFFTLCARTSHGLMMPLHRCLQFQYPGLCNGARQGTRRNAANGAGGAYTWRTSRGVLLVPVRLRTTRRGVDVLREWHHLPTRSHGSGLCLTALGLNVCRCGVSSLFQTTVSCKIRCLLGPCPLHTHRLTLCVLQKCAHVANIWWTVMIMLIIQATPCRNVLLGKRPV